MAVAASEIFDFIEQRQTWKIDKYEVASRPFSALRRAARTIILTLSGTDDSEELIYKMRAHLAEFLTVPIPFSRTTLGWIEEVFGDPDAVEERWGREVHQSYDIARASARQMENTENALRLKLRQEFLELRTLGTTFRIYCHRRAREHFKSILEMPRDEAIRDECFLHSAKGYRETEPFDTLIKVGPLRSNGWGAAPDALLTAPRFGRLMQIVWSGCADEEDFGYDPATTLAMVRPSAENVVPSDVSLHRSTTSWVRRITPVGDDLKETDRDVDDLKFFSELARYGDPRKAVFVQIDDRRGILFPPEARVPSFDPAALLEDAIDYRVPVETLDEGMFVIKPDLDEPDLGALRVAEGRYSVIWKNRLREAFMLDANGLLQGLRSAGIDLQHLRFCIKHWCKPPSTVIHAPQQRKHFEILIKTLGIDFDEPLPPRTARREWWQYGWTEIAKARGEAIQTGLQEQEIINEQLFDILRESLTTIGEQARANDNFVLKLPPEKSIEGAVQFYRVLTIEEGFLVPDIALRVVSDIEDIEQWRV